MTAEVEIFQPRDVARAQAPGQVTLGADPARADIDSWITVASDVIKLAEYICETPFVPKSYRNNPHATAAAILAGRELALPPMTALRHVQVVEGMPSLSAEYKRARVLAAGHELDILELSTTRCRVRGRRRGSGREPLEITFTIEDAKRAGLVKQRGAWETRPRRMLFARAGTEVCDFMFADVTNGLPTTELLEAGGTDEDSLAGYAESPGQAAPVAALPAGEQARSRTAQRRQRQQPAAAAERPTAPATGAPSGPARASAPAAAAASDGGLPPLPGEDEPGPTSGPQQDTGSSPSGSASDEIDKDAPGSVSKAQLTKLGAIFTEYHFTAKERDQRLAVASQVVRRELTSSSDLSLNEARTLIDTLESCGNRDNLMALLVAADQASGDGADA